MPVHFWNSEAPYLTVLALMLMGCDALAVNAAFLSVYYWRLDDLSDFAFSRDTPFLLFFGLFNLAFLIMFFASSAGEEVLWVRERDEETVEEDESAWPPGDSLWAPLSRGFRGCSCIGDSPRSSVAASARARFRMLTTLS